MLNRLRKNTFLLILMAGLVLLSAAAPNRISSYTSLVDWPTIAALTGLLLLTKELEVSGALHRLGRALIGLIATERRAALCVVMAAALLATVLTNDVALFVVVPLRLGVCRITKMPVTKLIVFEALAVNAGSALTPIGNPQNLFLWQLSKVSLGQFVWHMLPLVALLTAALIALTACAFRRASVPARGGEKLTRLDRPLSGAAAGGRNRLGLAGPRVCAMTWVNPRAAAWDAAGRPARAAATVWLSKRRLSPE